MSQLLVRASVSVLSAAAVFSKPNSRAASCTSSTSLISFFIDESGLQGLGVAPKLMNSRPRHSKEASVSRASLVAQSQVDLPNIHDILPSNCKGPECQQATTPFEPHHAEIQRAEFLHLRFDARAWDSVLVPVERRVPSRGDLAGKLRAVELQLDG